MGYETDSVFLLIVFAIVWVVFFLAYGGALIERKGISRWWLLGFMIPNLNLFFLFWVASMPDKALLDRLADLERRLESQS